jgi:predicted HTH transcriptional regulator
MVRIAKENGLTEPDFHQDEAFRTILYRPSFRPAPTQHPTSTHQVPTKQPPSNHPGPTQDPQSTAELPQEYRKTPLEVKQLTQVLNGVMSRQEMQNALELKDRRNFRENYIDPALDQGYIELIHPENPNHPRQKYRLTPRGLSLQKWVHQLGY